VPVPCVPFAVEIPQELLDREDERLMEIIGYIGYTLMLVGVIVIIFGIADQFQRDKDRW
jgi:uncharacterized membrane protein